MAKKPPLFKSSVLMRRIARVEKASAALAWKGAQHPEDHAALEREMGAARLKLVEYVLTHVLDIEPSPPTTGFVPCSQCGSTSLRCGCD